VSAIGFEAYQADLDRTLLRLSKAIPKWTKSLGTMLRSFEDWLETPCAAAYELSVRHPIRSWSPGTQPGTDLTRRCNSFETACRIAPMRGFACRCGRRNRNRWPSSRAHQFRSAAGSIETGTAVAHLPVWTIKAVVAAISRVPSPIWWSRISAGSPRNGKRASMSRFFGVEKEAKRRLDELMATVERLWKRQQETDAATPRGPGADRGGAESLVAETAG